MKTTAVQRRTRGAARSGALAIVLLVAMGSGVALASLVKAAPYHASSMTSDGRR